MHQTHLKAARHPRSSRCGFALAAAWLACSALAFSARAAEVRDVRVGRHPTFTRVVFELDDRAGYQIERAGDKSSVVVKLEARSGARSLTTKVDLVSKVELEPSGSRSIARIQLAKPGLPIKEMILASPPRIVLDFLMPEEAERIARSESSPAPRAKKSAPALQPAVVAEPKSAKSLPKAAPAEKIEKTIEKKSEPVVAATPAPKAETPAPALIPSPQPQELESDRTPVLSNKSLPDTGELEKPEESSDSEFAGTVDTGPLTQLEPEASHLPASPPVAPAAVPPLGIAKGAPPTPIQAAEKSEKTSKAAKQSADEKIAKSAASEAPAAAEPNWMLIFGGIGAVALVAGAGFLVMRRRSLPNDEDVLPFDESAPAFEDDELPVPRSADSFPEREDLPRPADHSFPFGGGGFSAEAAAQPETPRSNPATSLFDDEDEKGEQPMDQAETQIGTGMRGALPRVSSVGGDSDLARVVAELERRLTQTEQRIQEQNETVERLERQVAAHAEELRVQRAAIARTQRALRSMSRTEEEQATEPALRDPR